MADSMTALTLAKFLNHELRSPLGEVVLALTFFRDEIPDDTFDIALQERKRILIDVIDSIRNAVDTLNNVTLKTTPPLLLVKSDILIIEFINKCISKCFERLQTKKIKLIMLAPPIPVLILGFVNKSQVLTNEDLVLADLINMDNLIEHVLAHVIDISKEESDIFITPCFEQMSDVPDFGGFQKGKLLIEVKYTSSGAMIELEDQARVFKESVEFHPEILQGQGWC